MVYVIICQILLLHEKKNKKTDNNKNQKFGFSRIMFLFVKKARSTIRGHVLVVCSSKTKFQYVELQIERYITTFNHLISNMKDRYHPS